MPGETPSARQDRVPYFDCLRVFATFAVMLVHLSAQHWYDTPVNSGAWQVFNIYDSVACWAVPVFAMLSGALFLDREVPLRTVYGKYVLRLATAFVFWSFVYAAFQDNDGVGSFFMNALTGHYHLWFLPMMIGLYICLPLLRKFTADDGAVRYYLILALIFAFCIPQAVQLAADFCGVQTQKIVSTAYSHVVCMNLYLVLGYPSYFIAGWLLHKRELSRQQQRIILLLGLVGFAATIGLDGWLALRYQVPVGTYYEKFMVNILLESLAVFVWFRYHAPDRPRLNALMHKLSDCCFGAFLVHPLVIQLLNDLLGLHTLSFAPVLSVPLLCALVFVISMAIAWLLRKIPVLHKYVV